MLAGCASSAPAPQGPPTTPATVAATPATTASTSPATTASISPALAAELGADGRERLALAESLCQAAVTHAGGKAKVGCRACPPFDAATGPDGRVLVDPPAGDEFYELEAHFRGSFTSPGASEIAVVFTGCEPHAGNWGGTLLVEQRGGDWRARSYRSGFHPSECVTFRGADARDRLLCRWGTGHQGVTHEFLDVYDFVPDDPARPEAGSTRVLWLSDNSAFGCFDSSNEPIGVALIDAYRLEPATPLRLAVDVRVAKLEPTPTFHARCEDMAKATEPTLELQDLLKFEKKRLVFAWNGATFAPDPPTQAFLTARRLSVSE